MNEWNKLNQLMIYFRKKRKEVLKKINKKIKKEILAMW